MKKKIYYNPDKSVIPISIFSTIAFTIFIIALLIFRITSNKPFQPLEVLIYIFPLIMEYLLIVNLKDNIEDVKKHEEKLKKCIKVPGIIVKPITEWRSSTEAKYRVYFLMIKYTVPRTNQEKEIKTDMLTINPYKKIKSNKCSVYLLDDEVMVEDIELTKNKNECIFKGAMSKEDKKYLKTLKILLIIALTICAIGIIIFFSAFIH